ncbi:MAG TPA: serine/threonine-protein kinase [Anaerolineales bacterium]|nr:serine/threonine-protein kinase [Anaerolineales bacterium]
MDHLQSGQMLGPYRIMNQVGKGGMATVYKAYQASVDRYVAIKVLPSQLAESKEFAARFQQEARIIAKLEHPHILPVFDYGESDGVAYFVMRYLEAGTLKDKMETGRPLPLSEIDRIFTQLTDALSYAHSQGIVHRDLKPANALIDSHGNIFLTDFGIAKLLESASPRLTQTDAIMGTPAYISPEQARSHPVDQRSDIYSLGIILYEMVTGSVPFMAETPLAVLFKHISDPLPLPSSAKPDIPPSIEQVVLKALAKDPRDRFATATEFLEAWKRALAEKDTIPWVPEAVSAPLSVPKPTDQAQPKPASKTKTVARSARPAGWIAGCLAGLCLLFSVVGVAALALNWQNFSFLNPTAVNNTGTVILQDDFSTRSSNWGTLSDAESSIAYENAALRVQIFKENFVTWTTPNDQSYQNVHVEATIFSNNSDPNTAFGVMCAQQVDDWSYYYLAITPGGEYVIAKATNGQNDIFLTNGNQWGTSTLIPRNAPSYRVGADCGQSTLRLYVDGKEIAAVSDASYTMGRVGLFAWSGDMPNSADMTFDDVLLTSLE